MSAYMWFVPVSVCVQYVLMCCQCALHAAGSPSPSPPFSHIATSSSCCHNSSPHPHPLNRRPADLTSVSHWPLSHLPCESPLHWLFGSGFPQCTLHVAVIHNSLCSSSIAGHTTVVRGAHQVEDTPSSHCLQSPYLLQCKSPWAQLLINKYLNLGMHYYGQLVNECHFSGQLPFEDNYIHI